MYKRQELFIGTQKCAYTKLSYPFPVPSFPNGSETWIITQRATEHLKIFERKLLRWVLGPISRNGEWRIQHNDEVYCHFNEPTVEVYVKLRRLEWAGHVIKMDNN